MTDVIKDCKSEDAPVWQTDQRLTASRRRRRRLTNSRVVAVGQKTSSRMSGQ